MRTRTFSLVKMDVFVLLLLFTCYQRCLAQTDTNILAVGDWSESVRDSSGQTLRGRLIVSDSEAQLPGGTWAHVRVYLELQHVDRGVLDNPVQVLIDLDGNRKGSFWFEMRDEFHIPIAGETHEIAGPPPRPCWVVLPYDSITRVRADIYTLGSQEKPAGRTVFVPGGHWLLQPVGWRAYYLSAVFTPPGDYTPLAQKTAAPHDPQYQRWQGTLKLPKVKIPAKRP